MTDNHKQLKLATRIFTAFPLHKDGNVELSEGQLHYLRNVKRYEIGDKLAVFNGQDGEWLAEVVELRKNKGLILLREQIKQQIIEQKVILYFAPLKNTAMTFLIEKATELGVTDLCPVMTEFTNASRINIERLQANAIEAAQQCERMTVPNIQNPINLTQLKDTLGEDTFVYFCDETGHGKPIQEIILKNKTIGFKPAILIGPEGGFSQSEYIMLTTLANSSPVSLGPRILRAETAALYALTAIAVLN